MRKMIVTGRLGGEPEVKTTKNGINYTTFRIASQEYGEDTTTWISITVWDNALQNWCKNLHKGSSVIVDGDYSDRQYTSTKTNQLETGRDIRANSIYFGMLPPKEDNNTTQQSEPKAETVTKTPQSEPKITTVTPSAPSNDNNEDDLPF